MSHVRKEPGDDAVYGRRTLVLQPKDDDSKIRMCSPVEYLTKVEVEGQDHPLFLNSKRSDLGVRKVALPATDETFDVITESICEQLTRSRGHVRVEE